jgi:hypothetical protein
LSSTKLIKYRDCEDQDVAYVSSYRGSNKKSYKQETFGAFEHQDSMASGIKINASIADSVDDYGEI